MFYSFKQNFLRNRTTNERLRMRWNGDPDNLNIVKLLSNKSNCCSKLRYLCCHKIEKSKLEKYATTLELYSNLQ